MNKLMNLLNFQKSKSETTESFCESIQVDFVLNSMDFMRSSAPEYESKAVSIG